MHELTQLNCRRLDRSTNPDPINCSRFESFLSVSCGEVFEDLRANDPCAFSETVNTSAARRNNSILVVGLILMSAFEPDSDQKTCNGCSLGSMETDRSFPHYRG